MIQITRPPAPAFLIDTTGKWEVETQKAIAHYANGAAKEFDFKMYNDTLLKEELKKVFIKCAYCESIYGHVYDGDVEHFRPKGRIAEKNPPKQPGYYWLANDWDNLFLACQHCNQNRRHILVGDTVLQSYGKLDQFPLSDENKRLAGPHIPLEEEEPARLLLNPCKDNPSEHLIYEDTNGVISPLNGSKKGETSIKVYALQRPILVQERKKVLILLFLQMSRVKRELARINNDTSAYQKEVFEEELTLLLSFGSPESNYAGMCRFFIKQFLAQNGL